MMTVASTLQYGQIKAKDTIGWIAIHGGGKLHALARRIA